MSFVVEWLQNLADGIQHNRFLDYQVSTGHYGLPVAAFGLVTIATAVFVHVTFSDEISALGQVYAGQVYAAAEQGMNRATEMAEKAQVVISEQANRIGETVSSPPEGVKEGGGGRRKRKTTCQKRT
jgi:hypothetical protein